MHQRFRLESYNAARLTLQERLKDTEAVLLLHDIYHHTDAQLRCISQLRLLHESSERS